MHGVDSNVFHSYQYSALALGPLLSTHLLKLFRVISKCGFVLAACYRLELVGVLQLFDPLGFLRFETADLILDLLPSVVLFVNPVDEIHSLHLAFHHLFLLSQIDALGLLAADHLFHGFILKFFSALLHGDHFFMLLLLLLQAKRLVVSAVPNGHLVVHDGILLLKTPLVESFTLHGFLVHLLLLRVILGVSFNDVALTHLEDVLSLFLSLFNFLPSLLFLSLEKSNTVR